MFQKNQRANQEKNTKSSVIFELSAAKEKITWFQEWGRNISKEASGVKEMGGGGDRKGGSNLRRVRRGKLRNFSAYKKPQKWDGFTVKDWL